MDTLTITISFAALIFSGVSLFFQFFYHPRHLRVITMPMSRDGRIRFGVCNSGKESVYITGLSVDYSFKSANGMGKMLPVGNLVCTKSIVEPGSIVEFSYVVTDPPEHYMADAPEVVNMNGERAKTIDMLAHIQFAFSDGKVFSNSFKCGWYAQGGNSKSYQAAGVNFDLLDQAAPVSYEPA